MSCFMSTMDNEMLKSLNITEEKLLEKWDLFLRAYAY